MKHGKYKIGIWGQFGSGGQISDGQAVRTTIITEEIADRYGKENIKVINTNNWAKKPVLFFFKCILLVAKSEKIIIFPADNGFKVFVPILDFINFFFNRKLYYVVIGGFLPRLLNKKAKYIRVLKKYEALFVQTKNLKKEIEDCGLSNIYILSNLKKLKRLEKEEIKVRNEKYLTVCTFSRVAFTKGIEDAIAGVKSANHRLGDSFFKLDIYGMIDKKYEQTFKELLLNNSDFVNYKGVADYDKTVDTLQDYFTLLFPTFYHGEGLAGNVIDAFYAGLPIIATDWLYNGEVINNYVNGILIPVNKPEKIADALILMYQDRQLAHEIALNNIRESEKYSPKVVLKEFFNVLDQV